MIKFCVSKILQVPSYDHPWSFKAFCFVPCLHDWSLAMLIFLSCCYLIQDMLLSSLIKTRRKIQPCVGSWPSEWGRRTGQIMTTLSRRIHWLILHRVRQRDTTPARSPGLLAPADTENTPRTEGLGKMKWLWRQRSLQESLTGWALLPLGVLGTPQCWGVSAFEQEKLKEYIIKHINK